MFFLNHTLTYVVLVLFCAKIYLCFFNCFFFLYIYIYIRLNLIFILCYFVK